MADQHYDVLIVGGGQAGAHSALMLRLNDFGGSIAIIGEESFPPYDRPPLSKEYLSGEKSFEQMLLSAEEHWSELSVTMLLGRRVVLVDARAKRVSTSDGALIGYSALIWAAGGRPRKLTCPGAGVAGVHSVRNRAD